MFQSQDLLFNLWNAAHTFSGWEKVPALQGVLGSQSLTVWSQLPVTMTFTSGQYSTHLMGASWAPTRFSGRKHNILQFYWPYKQSKRVKQRIKKEHNCSTSIFWHSKGAFLCQKSLYNSAFRSVTYAKLWIVTLKLLSLELRI